MEDKTAAARPLNLIVAAGLVVALVGLLWWLWLLTSGAEQATSLASTERVTAADPASQATPTPSPTRVPVAATQAEPMLFVMSEPVLFHDDLGTGSTEFSAVTLNEDTNRLMIADDEGRLFEFDLDDAGLPIVPARRDIVTEVGDSDIEGIAWISDDTYVLAHEATGQLSLVEIDPGDTVVDQSDLQRIIDTQIREVDGNGIEGVTKTETFDDVEFIVVLERPPTLTFIDDDGVATNSMLLRSGVEDVADVWASPDGTVWVVSDMGRVVVRLTIGTDGVIRQLQQVDLVLAQGRFEQPEGLVVNRDGTRLYVVGEQPGAGQFTLGVWSLS